LSGGGALGTIATARKLNNQRFSTMPNGGRRPGAGRKSKAEEAGLQQLLDDAWTTTERKAVIKAMHKSAKAGNVKAAALLLSYAYGKPKVQIEHSGKDGEAIPIQIVEIVAPKEGKSGKAG
jgi:hypothetical protein